ncbi:retropepsin-like aspartic protease family protein [Teredinibacter purpureus]|uniref:retropepsin-like aspartic protease family protein n=1 Tax=Teredinibacter purpureus TaxID=2731756 RepID=UPI00069686A9|nr:retropepsin-like aspartic protease [Teredinibacter purpureus]
MRFILFFLVAFSLGWFSHAVYLSFSPGPLLVNALKPPLPHSSPHHENSVPALSREKATTLPQAQLQVPQVQTQHTALDETLTLQVFSELLSQYRFQDAVNMYGEAEPVLSTNEQQQWRSVLLDYLSRRINSGETVLFSELAEIWLQVHYNDVDVLLQQARFYRVKGYYGEALQTYMLAKTYAYYSEQKANVFRELQSFVFQRDSDWSGQGDWHELLNFYAQLEQFDISNKAQQFRYAELLLMHNDERSAEAILDALMQFRGWKERVTTLRAHYQREGEYHAGTSTAPGFQTALPIKPVGSHYLMRVRINTDETPTTLLLDTGASITTVTVEAFAGMVQAEGWRDLGWHLFNTANGPAQGKLMEIEQFTMGDYTLRNLTVAVLDTNLGDGVQGLLGMNVLSQFHFQIDQDSHRLLLTPRD